MTYAEEIEKSGNLMALWKKEGYQKALDDVLELWSDFRDNSIDIYETTYNDFIKKIEELR